MAFKEKYPIKSNDFTLPAPGKRAVLLIHGYTGSPMHFKAFAEYLNKDGIHCRVMRLPGHGGDARDLARTTYLDWREAVHNELKALDKSKTKVYILGYSFGSNLALDAARHYPDLVAGLIAFATPIFLRHHLSLRLLIRFFNRYSKTEVRRKPWVRRKRVAEYEAAGTYAQVPIKSTQEFLSFIDDFTKPHLKDVKVPCLILQAKEDPVVHPKSAAYIFNHLGSRDKKLVMIPGKEHATVSEAMLRRAYKETLDFIISH